MKHIAFKTALGLLLLMSLWLSACNSAPPATEAPKAAEDGASAEATPAPAEAAATPEAAEAATSGEKVKVVIFVGMGTGTDPDQIAAQEALAEKFNTSHDDIEIEFLIVPVEESGERFLAMVSGGTAPQLVGPNGISTIAEFFDTWADITPFIEAEQYDMSDFYGPAVALNEYPEKNTGLPLGLYPSFVFYNKDLFDAAGLDYPTHDFEDKNWTMDKLREIAIQMTLDNNGNNPTAPEFDPENIVQWGFDDSWADGRGYLTKWGGPGVGRPTSDDYKTAQVNAEEWVYGLQWLSDGVWKDYFIPNGATQEARDALGADPFGGGTTAMFYSHTWFMPEGLVDLPFEHDVAPLPFNQKGERIARIHADNFTIPKNAEHQQEAWEVMKWLVAPEQIVDVCLIYGCLPARKSVEEEYLAVLQERYPNLDYEVIFKSIDYLDNPNHESWVPAWGRVGDAINNAVSLVYSGAEKDAQKALDQANTEVQTILDEYWATQK
jgi:multiple sugar transport system substrate-binding protein